MAANALRAAKPKLTLSVPTVTNPAGHAAPKSPFPMAVSPSPLSSPTARNTLLNQRGGLLYAASPVRARAGFQTLTNAASITSAPRAAAGTTKRSAMKQPTSTAIKAERNIAFREEPSVKCISPMPEDYYGEYRKLGRDERRWVALM